MPARPAPAAYRPTDPDALLHALQCHSFGYFVHETNPCNGLVLDKTAPGWPASIAAVGMALTAWPVGVERGLATRAEAVRRTLATLRFFHDSDQSGGAGATGHRGFYFHFLDMASGARARGSELSSIDTALLIAGVLAARAYFAGDDAEEAEIRRLAAALNERVEWDWMLDGGPTLSHGWTPERGFLPWRWRGYDESLILQLLALGSPTHAIPATAYDAWTASFRWRTVYGIDYLHAGPLFVHQLSHVWVDLRGLRDAFMRAHDCDYFDNSRRATQAQRKRPATASCE